MSEVFVSTGAFASRRLNEVLSLASEWGLTHLELGSEIGYDPGNVGLAREARRRFRLVLHNYFPAPSEPFVINLASADPDILKRSRSHCRAALELSADLEAPLFAAHAGFTVQPAPAQLGRPLAQPMVSRRQDAYSTFVDCVGELSTLGRRLGVRFLVENNVVSPFNVRDGGNPFLLLAEPDEIMRCAADVGDSFGLLMDVGHLKVTAQALGFDAVEALQAVGPSIAAWHLSDNDGEIDNNRAFDASAWFISHLNDAFPITLEVYNTSEARIREMMRVLDHSGLAVA